MIVPARLRGQVAAKRQLGRPVTSGEQVMHIVGWFFIEALAQEWYVLAAYLLTFLLLEVRKHGERIAMHRVTRHALWAASVVVVVHSLVVAVAMVRKHSVDFVVVNYALVMALTGSLLYLLGLMFEKAPPPSSVQDRKAE
jgi:hypothetical protein